MNRIYRLVWNSKLDLWVAASENANVRGNGTSVDCRVAEASINGAALAGGFRLHARCRAALVLLLSFSVGNLQVHAADAGNATLVIGSGTVATSGATTTINQTSQRMAIDWTSLSTATTEALLFNQPNASAIALNRITGSSPSELLGSLTANGQVFILNPNGVLFGAGSQVNVGGLVASTLNMSNADFIAGGTSFTGNGSAASVVNKGTMAAAPGGYLALLAPEVRNEGVMTANLGTALLAAGNKVTLNLDNGSLLGYSIDQGAVNALAENKQLIRADGGQVLLGAKALDRLTMATVNNTGFIEAKTIQNKAGRILLVGDMETGTVNVAGTLDARAPDGGDGGFIETSAAHVNVADAARITTKAANGKTGQWLVDPFDFVVAAAGGNITGANLGIQLDANNVTLNTTSGNSGTNGDLSVNDAVAWSAANTLTLIGERDVNVNANLTYSGSGTAGVTVQAVRDINIASNIGITSAGTGALPVVLGGPTVGTAAGGNINMASGSSIATNGGDVTFKANAIQLSGAAVAAAGGNIAMTASGANATHALEITNAGATQSNVSTTGAGTIKLSGALTGDGSSASGAASGVKITSSTVSAGAGDVSISGDSAWAGGVVTQIARGVRLDSGAKVLGAGKITVTGRVGNLGPRGFSQAGAGVEVGPGAEVSSTAGDIAITGTFTDSLAQAGTGVIVKGKMQSGASKGITLTGTATTGNMFGTGVLIGTGANLVAGTLGLTVVGTTNSATTATAILGTSMDGGSISSTGAIDIQGTLNAASAVGGSALYLGGGSINSNGAAITLRGSGVAPSAPTASRDIYLTGTTVASAGGEIKLMGDRIQIDSSINAGACRVVITPSSINRQVTLGGSDENNALNLTNFELNRITAGTLVIGGSTLTGGIDIAGAISPLNISSLSLINENINGPGHITQSAGLAVANLNAVAASVTLSNTANQISQISGRTLIGNLNFYSATALSVGTVDGIAGLSAAGGSITLASGGSLTQTQAIVNPGALTASSAGGTTLDAGNQIGSFNNIQNSGSGDVVLRNSGTATFGGVSNGGGRIDISNTGHVTLNSTISSSNATNVGGTAATAAISVQSTGRISAGVGGGVTNSNGGSVYLQAGNGSIGSNSANRVAVATSGAVTAVAAGGTSEINLALSGGATVENISAPGAVRVSAAAGNLAVRTVSGSAVTLSAAAGAILDANGAANNITAGTLNATAANGITLGTNVTGLHTLSTTGATGDISITAANTLNTSNLNISTDASAAQNVSLSSGGGITVDTAFGNSQDNFKLIATGGNLIVNATLQANKLTLSTTGTSAQTAGIIATGLELLGTGSHTLANAGNAVTTLAGNTGNVDYAQTGALAIGTVNTAGLTTTGKVLVRTTGAAGDITLNNGITSGSPANDSLVLAAGRNFVNNAGANPLSPGAGRFLVYSTDPTANSFGAMVSTGNAFNRSFAANGPADASMTSLAGNRFVYSVQPTLNVSGDNKTKISGGADPVLTYTVASGLVAGDTAATALAGALSAPTGAATTGTTYAITQGTLASALGYNVAYTDGTLSVSGIPPAPAPASATAPAAGGGTTATQTTPNIAALGTGNEALAQAYVSALLVAQFPAPGGQHGAGDVNGIDANRLANILNLSAAESADSP
ncbi:MAG: filamentous hemagglutinin N-terminal protein [Spirosoma sp.]|nr:filamentous hemagglutinin N-terminal protein [Spirosoma sp.]